MISQDIQSVYIAENTAFVYKMFGIGGIAFYEATAMFNAMESLLLMVRPVEPVFFSSPFAYTLSHMRMLSLKRSYSPPICFLHPICIAPVALALF